MEENGDEEIIQKLYVRLPSNKTIVICDIDGAETIAELKKRIDWAWDGFDLVYEMNVLEDVECIGSYDIMSEEYIRVMARRGQQSRGWVHNIFIYYYKQSNEKLLC